jgi:hypothetical protein
MVRSVLLLAGILATMLPALADPLPTALIMPELQRPPHRHQLGLSPLAVPSLTATTPRSSLSGPAGARWHGHELYCGRRALLLGLLAGILLDDSGRRLLPPRRLAASPQATCAT